MWAITKTWVSLLCLGMLQLCACRPRGFFNPTIFSGPRADPLGIVSAQLYAKVVYRDSRNVQQLESLVVYLWLRRTVDKDGHHIRGFAWAESALAPDLENWDHLTMPSVVQHWTPQFLLHLPGSSQVLPFTMFAEHLKTEEKHRPVHFEVKIPENAMCFHISEASWPKLLLEFCVLPEPGVCQSFAAATPAQPAAWNVLPVYREPGGGVRAERHREYGVVLAHHIMHHRSMGFAGVIQYATPRERYLLSQDPTLQMFIGKGWLKLMPWDNFKWTTNIEYPAFDQHLTNSHAILAFQDCGGVMLSFFDADEFFTTWKPQATVHQALFDCFPKGGSLFQLLRFDIKASRFDDEYRLWIHSNATYADCHPLNFYDRVKLESRQRIHGKHMILSHSGVYGFFVHEGLSRTPTGFQVGDNYKVVDKTCATILHAANLYVKRVKYDHSSRAYSNWLYNNGDADHLEHCLRVLQAKAAAVRAS